MHEFHHVTIETLLGDESCFLIGNRNSLQKKKQNTASAQPKQEDEERGMKALYPHQRLSNNTEKQPKLQKKERQKKKNW